MANATVTTMANTTGAIVWGYHRRYGCSGFPFTPSISNDIEDQHSLHTSGQTNNCSFPLVSKKTAKTLPWVGFDLDLSNLRVSNASTGESHKICRQVFPPDSVYSQGYNWVVEGDRPMEWIPYDFDTSQLIENTFSSAKSKSNVQLDLTRRSKLPYILDLKSKIQTNVKTGKTRKMKRKHHSHPYHGTCANTASSGDVTSNGASASLSPSRSLELEHVIESLPRRKRIHISRSKEKKTKTFADVEKYMEVIPSDSVSEEDCIMCIEKLSEDSAFVDGQQDANEVVKLVTCGHSFHRHCLEAMYKHDHKEACLQCPICKMIYGEKFGNCPPGTMMWDVEEGLSLPGYEGFNTIKLTYIIPNGVQGPDDPNPGEQYTARGFPRNGFLPDCNLGRKVLKLLIEAFERKLMFTIGTSITTGRCNTVTWNEIHLKTNSISNIFGHGYPDPLYLDNVLMELASHGLRAELVQQEVEEATVAEAEPLCLA